jgi:hypothetical protein
MTMVGPIRSPGVHPGDEFMEIYANGAAVTRPIQLEQPLAPVHPGLALWEHCGHPERKGRAEFKRFTVWKLPPNP